MDDHREARDTEYREPFPYKTYDEILSEKTRKERFRHAMVVVTGVFLMLCAIIVGIGMVWSNMANVFHVSKTNARSAPAATGWLSGLMGPRNAEQYGNILEDSDVPLFTEDVTAAVEAAASSVVSITAEHCAASQTQTGSGLVMSKKGYIVTLCSLISDCDKITVTLHGGARYTAFIVGTDQATDLAVLKISADGLVPAVIGCPELAQDGDPVIALGGGAAGAPGSASLGTVSAFCKNVLWQGEMLDLVLTGIRLDLTAFGGPLIDKTGAVIGLCSAKIFPDDHEGISAALSIDSVRGIVAELVSQGYVARPMVGIQGSSVDNVPQTLLPEGLYVVFVPEESPAAKAGLMAGDTITHVGDVRVTSPQEAYLARNAYRVGEAVEITFYRHGINYRTTLLLSGHGDFQPPVNY
ncbi:MAG: serine protease [Clostridia bacterium]|nr:serine protease [Clostridia bacterium]